MIKRSRARQLLLDSIHELEQNNGSLNADAYAADIINITCRYFLENYTDIESGPNPLYYFNTNYSLFHEEVSYFIGSIQNDYPELLTDNNISNLTHNVCLNLGFNGMSEFLDDYFYKTHGLSSDEDTSYYEFSSSEHIRYENGIKISSSNANRQISVVLKRRKQCMHVTISPSLSLKIARFSCINNGFYIYKEVNGDYIFYIHFDEYDSIDSFRLTKLENDIRVTYL